MKAAGFSLNGVCVLRKPCGLSTAFDVNDTSKEAAYGIWI